MGGSALRGDDTPDWGGVKQVVMSHAEAVADAVMALLLRGCDSDAVRAVEHAVMAFREAAACLRYPMLDEAVIEAERSRAYEDGLAAAGLVPPQVPPQRARHLHSVS